MHIMPLLARMRRKFSYNVIYYEKNLAENVLKTLIGEMGIPVSCVDMQKMNIHKHLQLHKKKLLNPNKWKNLKLDYVFSEEERSKLLDILQELKLPTRFVGGFKKHIKRANKPSSMKTSNFHIFIQQCCLHPFAIYYNQVLEQP